MNHSEEIGLLDELLGLRQEKSAFLDERVQHSPTSIYTDPDRFAAEQATIFRSVPLAAAHISELAEDGAFLRRTIADAPILLTRDRNGDVHAFYNVCRHRGARLVEAVGGCRHRFTCPYHAWTWDNTGRLIGVPHQDQGFPDLDKTAYGLKRVSVAVRHGWVWVQLDGDINDDWFDGFEEDMRALGMEDHAVFAAEDKTWAANWKIIGEGGLEAYHFRVAHTDTIAGLFHNNLSSYQVRGPHIRSILARSSIDMLVEKPRIDWRLRDHTNLLYSMFPNISFLVQSDHIAVIIATPEAADSTTIRLMTLVPKEEMTEDRAEWWGRNHGFTRKTLDEDFAIAASIQSGLSHGVNERLTFGRFEGALHAYNQVIDARMA